MLAALKVGESIVAIEARFCVAQGRKFLPNGGAVLEYALQRSASHPGPATVYLRFAADGRFETQEVRGH
jgi:hypothetical protein